jgi:hypothetical protein
MGNQPSAGIEKELESFLEKDKLWGFVNVNKLQINFYNLILVK